MSVRVGAASAADATPAAAATRQRLSRRSALLLALALGAATWAPRLRGPIDLRWDAGVYYELGTSLAQGKGYRLLNEPGQPAADEYPPLLPAVIAVTERALGTSDMTRVGAVLRPIAAALFLLYVWIVFRFFAARFTPAVSLLGTALAILTLHVYFLSDLAFPEVPFAVCLLLYLDAPRGQPRGAGSLWPYAWATLAYALRTAGIAALAAWVAESVFAWRLRQALFRSALAIVPVIAWQAYVASVEASDAYHHPAYAYQRAAYMFYNVSYAKNIALRDPFAPEKGLLTPATAVIRVAHNAIRMPASIGETLVTSAGYFDMALLRVTTDAAAAAALRIVIAVLYAAGCLALLGLVAGAIRGDPRIVIFTVAYLGLLCTTPFPDQFLRYLMPLAPVVVAGVLTLSRRGPLARAAWTLAIIALCVKAALLVEVFTNEHQRITYTDRAGRLVEYRLFFYDAGQQDFDRAVDYVQAHAASGDVVAAGTPHWIHLRTGLTSVMPPYDVDPRAEQALLDSVPVTFLMVGPDPIRSERYTAPMLATFAASWSKAFVSPGGYWSVYQRVR